MIRTTLLSSLMLSAALVATAANADAPATTRLSPMWGTIEPFWGTIEPFSGSTRPAWGTIEPFSGATKAAWGTIEPFWGTIEPFWGTIEPFAGATKPTWGTIEPFWGTIEPFWGTIEPFKGSTKQTWGTIEPFWGTIEPFWGTIEPFKGSTKQTWGTIEPFWGTIEPFWGTIEPFKGSTKQTWGTIEPFWGTIEPFWGTIEPFKGVTTQAWGTIEPFWGTIEPFSGGTRPSWGTIEPFWGTIEPFWGTIEPFWGTIEPFWGTIEPFWSQLQASNATDYSVLQTDLQTFVAKTQTAYGAAIEKATNKSFNDAFADPLLKKYGIDLSNPSSLAGVDARTRTAFILDWYDNLMTYSGMPIADWWMGAVKWSPLLTQIENSGTHAVIGILDSKFTDNSTNVRNLQFVGGYDYYVNDHGAAVASLLASQHTAGKVMGIAPNSPVLLYNPFDTTGTASWDDVAAGIYALYAKGASVINASMGVPGQMLSDEWASIMTSSQLKNASHSLVLVKAAGNEGVAQTTNINWIGSQAPNNLILVGSVGPTGTISPFSNTPGDACILIHGVCNEQNKLMYHFIVAPGENILVSNNNGGVLRASGTSFAAPLVSGAVALLQDRWPWLKNYADETVQIIFQSAKDLGAPGVDPIYGWGELDIEASQSPLDINKLIVLQPGSNSFSHAMSTATLKSALLDPGQLALWDKKGAYLIAYESIGSTFRDFDIPLSSLLASKKLGKGQNAQPFQTYLYQRLIDWANAPGAASFNAASRSVAKDDWSFSLTTTQASPDELRRDQSPVHYEFAAVNSKTGLGFRFGEGAGAYALTGMQGFAQRSDFDPATGGVNPVLGFASGGAYGRAEMTIGKARFSAGFSQKRDDHMIIDPTYGLVQEMPLNPNRAFASVMGVDYEVSPSIKLNASYTALREADGLLGSQGAGMFNMAGGTHTTATTVGASFTLPQDWSLHASATTARSAAPQFLNAALSFSADSMNSTAYELVAIKTGLFDKQDQLRLSIAQPLHIEAGAIQFSTLQVVDRQTGELGTFTQQWDVSGKRELRMEALYGTAILDGAAQLDGYALVDVNPHASRTGATELAIGWRARFAL